MQAIWQAVFCLWEFLSPSDGTLHTCDMTHTICVLFSSYNDELNRCWWKKNRTYLCNTFNHFTNCLRFSFALSLSALIKCEYSSHFSLAIFSFLSMFMFWFPTLQCILLTFVYLANQLRTMKYVVSC